MFRVKTINWGILGTAGIVRKRMIKPLQKTEGNRCWAIASRNREKAQKEAKEFNIPKYYGSYDELIGDKDIHAIYIPLPNSMHYSWVIRAAEKGKHILCEKPIGYSTSQVQEMIQICKKRSVLLLEAHSYFLHPRYTALFKLLNEDIIGKVKQIQVHFSFPAREKEHGIRFKYELGGGSLLDIGCYGVDLVHQIFDQELQTINAVFDMENKVDMEFLGLLKFEGNAEAIIRTSFKQERRQTLTISGEKGSIFLPDAFIPADDKTYIFIKTPKGAEIKEIENVNQYLLLVKEFTTQMLERKDLSMLYKRYLRNAHTLGRLLTLQKNGGPKGKHEI